MPEKLGADGQVFVKGDESNCIVAMAVSFGDIITILYFPGDEVAGVFRIERDVRDAYGEVETTAVYIQLALVDLQHGNSNN